MSPWLCLIAAAVLNTVVGHAVLLRRGRAVGAAVDAEERPLRALHVGQAAVAVLLVTLLEAALFAPLGLAPYGLLHLVWLDLVVVVPLCAVELLLASARGRRVSRPARGLAVLGLLTLPLLVYAWSVEPRRVEVAHVHVPLDAARAGERPLRIAVLADLEIREPGSFEQQVVDQVLALRPDVILLPGDVFGGRLEDLPRLLPQLRALLARLSAPHGVYLVAGDSDFPGTLATLVADTEVQVLRDEVVTRRVGDRVLSLLGLAALKTAEDAPALLADFDAAPGDDVRLLLVHRPQIVLALPPDSRVDLVVAGHTHGGQVALPFVGPLLTGAAPLSRRVAAGGLHELDGRRLYVSRGLGLKGPPAPPIRFLAPPEVTLLTLH